MTESRPADVPITPGSQPPASPTPGPPAAAPAPAPPEVAPPVAAQPVGVQPEVAQPFAPIVRAPRMPWVNPARRLHVGAAAVVGALIFAGGGIAIGAALDGGHNGNFERVRIERAYLAPGGRAQLGPGGGIRIGPRGGNAPAVPSTAPSPGKTS